MIISRAVLSSQQGPQGGSVVWKPCEAGMVGHLLGKQPGEGRTPTPPSSPTNMPQKGERTPCTHSTSTVHEHGMGPHSTGTNSPHHRLYFLKDAESSINEVTLLITLYNELFEC